MNDATIMPLKDLYLNAIVAACRAHKLLVALQNIEAPGYKHKEIEAGRLWMLRDDTTVPDGSIDFIFERDAIGLSVTMRNQREFPPAVVKYAEGLDGWLEAFDKFMRAGLLSAPQRRRA